MFPWTFDGVICRRHTDFYRTYANIGAMSCQHNSCLRKVANWMSASCLKFNSDKTEVLVVDNNPSIRNEHCWPKSLGNHPSPKSEVKSLGVISYNKLTTEAQSRKLSSSCSGLLRILRTLLGSLPSPTRRVVLQGLVLSRLDYGNSLYLGSLQSVIKKTSSYSKRCSTDSPVNTKTSGCFICTTQLTLATNT